MSTGTGPWQHLNLGRNVRFAVGEFAISAALLFFGYRLLITSSGLEAVGVWATLYAWSNIIRLGDIGVAGAATRYLALRDATTDRDYIRTYGETALITNLVQFGLLALLGYFVLDHFAAAIVGADHAAQAAAVVPWMMLGFFLLNIAGTIAGMLQGLHLGYRRSQLSVLGNGLQLLVVFALVPDYGLLGLALAQIVQNLFICVIGWAMVRRLTGSGWLPVRFCRAAFGAMLGYSLKAQLVNIANGLIEPVAKILVGHFGGMATQGLFELAYKTVLVPRNLIGTAITATTPAMAALFSHDRPQLNDLYRQTWRTSVAAMSAVALGLLALAPIPSLLWLGRIDDMYWLYVGMIAVGYWFNILGAPAYVLGVASGHLHHNILATLFSLAVLATLGSAFGWFFGGAGSIAATAIAIGLGGILIAWLNRPLLTNT